ncbi:hypothetical protein K466DRAFT_643756 [Polyporus arcularius HHB13444]|uniref:Uncharacterized protein n=2 Tax=Polyporaceae TaxID=5317 RepID=A0A5C3PPH0_9APHY|nr:hypothetical protein K466DRAFT_643756 [Polyporus arcularius HHB13444]
MPPPPIQVFLTTIASQPALRQRQEYVLRVLQVKKAQFTSYDLASDEDAKKLWRRKAPLGYEEAVEFGELDQFLRLNENWDPLEDDKPLLRAVPVGIPGAYAPAQMNPEHISPAPSPIKSKHPHREGELDAGDKLGDSSLHGVNVTDDELLKLVEELGLDEASANDLVKGLAGEDAAVKKAPAPPEKEAPAASVKEGPAAALAKASAAAKEPSAATKEKPAVPTKDQPPAVPVQEVASEKTEVPKLEVKIDEPAASTEEAKAAEKAEETEVAEQSDEAAEKVDETKAEDQSEVFTKAAEKVEPAGTDKPAAAEEKQDV